jgi:predicted oxidoreductase
MVNGRVVKERGGVTEVDVGDVLGKAQEITEEIWGNLFHDRPQLRDLMDA